MQALRFRTEGFGMHLCEDCSAEFSKLTFRWSGALTTKIRPLRVFFRVLVLKKGTEEKEN